MAERAEELRTQLDVQRAGISRTVEQIENRVVPGRVLNRRRYKMRRSVMDWKDRLIGNDETDYPSHWYAQPTAPLAGGYGEPGTRYSFDEGRSGSDEGGRFDDARERAGGAMHDVSDRASGAMHDVSDRASGAVHEVSDRAQWAAHEVSDRVQDAPQMMRRQTRGNPTALGLMAFGAGLLAGTLLPETRKEKELARQAQPGMQWAVEEAKDAAGEVAADLREPIQESVDHVKETAAEEAQAFKGEATHEAKQAKDDVGAAAKR